jgi:RNA processing factor Prp31
MNKELNAMVDKSIEAAEDVTGYEMTEADMEYTRQMIERISGFYMRKDADKALKRKIKTKRRAANKVARKSRRTNRK